MTTGEPLIVRAAMKPISTTLTPLGFGQSGDRRAGSDRLRAQRLLRHAARRRRDRGDGRLVLADELLIKLGGDSLDEMRPRFEALRRGTPGRSADG